MYNEKITEICSHEWKRIPIRAFKKKIRILERKLIGRLNIDEDISEWRLLQKEIRQLLAIDKTAYISISENGLPVIGELLHEMRAGELTFTNISGYLAKAAALKYLHAMDIDSAVWQAKYVAIYRYINSSDNVIGMDDVLDRLMRLTAIDQGMVSSALNPLERVLREDSVYKKMTAATKAAYRRMIAETAIATSRDELRLAREYMMRAESKQTRTEKKQKSYVFSYTSEAEEQDVLVESVAEPQHVGELILDEYRSIFPHKDIRPYAVVLMIAAILSAVLVGLVFGIWGGILSFLPLIAIVKPIFDLSASRTAHIISPPPSLDLDGAIPDHAKTLCVISTLLTKPEDVLEGLDKIKTARQKNRTDNLYFCLLADLAPAKQAAMPSDNEILRKAKYVFAREKGCCIVIRERTYSKTQRLWQGEERKRGAIIALARLLSSGKAPSGIRALYGDKICYKNIKYLAALDYDTVPLMDSISELVGIALHPLNKDKSIIAPRMTTTLSSYLKTGFSRLMTGNGGTAGASTYDSFAGELYQDCYGEGTFTGKGLIDLSMLMDKCTDDRDFPAERVLSHDILEGGHLGVVYAGNVEFCDSFPETSSAYFKRQHRWLRGDLQNFPQIWNKRFSPLTRWKLFDNVRRAVSPIAVLVLFVYGIAVSSGALQIIATVAAVMTYFMGFFPSVVKGWRFANYRRFYAPVISQTKQLVYQLVLELCFLPKNALVSLDALLRTMWRMLFSKRHLLDWTTFSAFGKGKKGHLHLLAAEILAVGIFALAAATANWFGCAISVFFISALPLGILLDQTVGRSEWHISKKMEEGLLSEVGKMWRFYNDFVTDDHHFLPPDNVQYSPVYRVCENTSPTNIGMYLLSLLSVYKLGIIDDRELLKRASQTLSTVEMLEKWNGNLMNWYNIKSLKVISPFVSSVDSGNFVCCLVVLKEGLKELSPQNPLIPRISQLIDSTNLKPFFNNSKQLFSVGYDMERKMLSPHHYDLLMSESRMLSYFAIASGQVGKRHWQSLGRIMSKDGKYAAPIAWTGTMFEYFMPELILESREGSLQYEALKFALHCQKKRAHKLGLPFGISESGYYAFDNNLNYQYKAHGVAAAGLKEGLDNEYVISPYSSFLALQLDPIAAYNNLVLMEDLSLTHPDYGFYEAADFTKKRVGSGYGKVKSHMAHHIGMSIAAVTNVLSDKVLQKLFLTDETMKRAEELLDEKIIAGETILGEPDRQKEDDSYMNIEEYRSFSLESPHVTALSNGTVTLFCSDIGMQETLYKGLSNVRHTHDLRSPRGSLYGFVEGEHQMPFFWHPSLGEEVRYAEQSVVFGQNKVEYYRNYRNLLLGMQVYLHPHRAIEIRRFSAENEASTKRQLTLAAYLEPTLMRNIDYDAHPAFMDMFLNVTHDKESNLFIVKRKDRNSHHEVYMAVGTLGEQDIAWSFNRERVIRRNGGIFSALDSAASRDCDTTEVPSPCLLLKIDFPLDAGEKRDCELFYCYGKSLDEVKSLAHGIRFANVLPSDEIISPLVYDTIYGRLTRSALPHLLYTPQTDKEAVMTNVLDKKALWQFGISGDLPIILVQWGENVGCIDAAFQMKKALMVCGYDFDLVVIHDSDQQKHLSEKLMGEIGTNAFLLSRHLLSDEMLTLIKTIAVYSAKSDDIISTRKTEPTEHLPIERCQKQTESDKNGFSKKGDKYMINETPDIPWCNVLANSQFGTLLSDCSLGFSWALNSRENKLSPWENDLRMDNKGELLLIKGRTALHDIIDGSNALFAPNKADYHGAVGSVLTSTSVRVFEKGMGKELTVTLENTGKTAKSLQLAYYIEPVLGASRESAVFIKPSSTDNTLLLSTPANDVFSGSLCITSDKKASFLTDRTAFFGGEWGKGKLTPHFDICGAVIVDIKLPPKHKDKVRFILSFTKNSEQPTSMFEALLNQDIAEPVRGKDIEIGDSQLSALYKHWLPWQAIGCRMWARTGFYQNSGAFGFRDQLQDALTAIEVKPNLAKQQIINSCCSQFIEGDVLHWWHSLMSKRKGVRTRYSDDLLWLPYVLSEYVSKTGDKSILDIMTPYAEAPVLAEDEHERYLEITHSSYKESVYDHAKRAFEKAYQKGQHGLLLMGSGDWCDGYSEVGVKGKGESVWLSMFYAATVTKFVPIAEAMGDNAYAKILQNHAAELRQSIDENAWDNNHYLRAFYDDGSPMGSESNQQCKIDLLPQAFSVFADMPDASRRLSALTAAIGNLTDNEEGIIKLFSPPFEQKNATENPGYVMSYPPGMRENGGQYTHASIWLALAAYENGMDETALKLTELLKPYGRGDNYKTEPYYLAADIYTNPKAYGRGGWSIYTGSAGWYYQLLGKLDLNDKLVQ